MAQHLELEGVEQWQELWKALADPGAAPALVFKHSHRCSFSRSAKQVFDMFVSSAPEGKVRFYLVNVITARAISQQIASDTGVAHQSPQAIFIGPSGNVTWHASHGSITTDALAEASSQV